MTRIFTKRTRFVSWLLALLMILSLAPFTAFAAEGDDDMTLYAADPEPPLVNVIETETGAEADGEAAEDPALPAETDDAPETDADEPAAGSETETPASAESADEPDSGETGDEPASGETDGEQGEAEDASDEPDPAEDGDGETFVVSYYADETLLSQETVEKDAVPAQIPTRVEATGELIMAWKDAEGAVVAVSETPVTEDVSYYAWLMPQLETSDHIRYIDGKGDNLFCPTDSLTRAEAAKILCNLLRSSEPGPKATVFSDVPDRSWFYSAVMTLASYGIVGGYPDGTYRPTANVTRAEFITILVRMTGVSGSRSLFTDADGHWAAKYLNAAAAEGWLTGYKESDGTYTCRPDREISRAEAVTLVNRVVGRTPDKQALTAGGAIMVFLDVDPDSWYYFHVMEASVPHEYVKSESGEVWQNYSLQDIGLAPGKHQSGNRWYLINGDGLAVAMKAGINLVDGKYYYAPAAGSTFTGDLSSKAGYCVFADGTEQKLADKFNSINGTLFYWYLSSASAMKMKAGLNTIDGTTYWADEAGYVIRNDFSRGVVTLGGKKYLSNGYCDIITTGTGYRSTTSKPSTVDLREQLFEFSPVEGKQQYMYYLKSDYSLACDEWVEYLYFGKDCAYTSGNATIDTYVWSIVKGFINNSSLTKEQKLLKAYYYIRGGTGQNFAASPYKYRSRSAAYQRGRYNGHYQYDWIINSAVTMIQKKAGMCYEWAAIYLFMARRLGFQSYIVVGSVFYEQTRHCWCMIKWDNKWHISDVEIEWGYLAGWYGTGQSVYRNLFAQTVSNEFFKTYKHPECELTYWVWDESYLYD